MCSGKQINQRERGRELVSNRAQRLGWRARGARLCQAMDACLSNSDLPQAWYSLGIEEMPPL